MPIRQLRQTNRSSSSGFSSHSIGRPSRSRRTRSSSKSRSSSREKNEWLRSSVRGPQGPKTPKKAKRPKKSNDSTYKKLVLRFIFRVGIAGIIIGIVGAGAAFAWYSRDLPDPNKIIERDVAQSTKIYDRTGEVLLYEIHGAERRTIIELSDIPQYAINATIAIEDKNFYTHGGFSLPNLAKAVILEALSKVGLYKSLVPGGSTLTQQLIKNAVLTTEKSYERKIKELVLAYRLEKEFTKDEILKLYFNEIPYGSTAYGIETASHIYFDKSARDLTLAEAAVLAAMPQAPSYYSPYGSHVDELIGRQQYVLDLMADQGYITEEEAEAAKNEEIIFKRRREDIKAPHFVFMVKEQLAARYGERLIETGGLKIITTLDADKQNIAEEVIEERAENNLEQHNASNAALVSIDVDSGEVLALVGSRDFFDDEIDGQVNVATSLRQPGSSLKPLIYVEAFNQGYRPDTVVYDIETSFAASGRDYRPRNYDLEERGPITFRSALQGSLNIPAVKALYLIGVGRAVELAQELGYTSLVDPDRYGLSLVLGGAEVKLIEHTNAYASFAREGIVKPYITVLKVEGPNGETLEEHRNQDGRRALDRNVVRTLNNVLSDNAARAYAFGENNNLTLPGRPVAAKTGTTNDYRDAWTIGYTPSLATGVWAGNADNEEMTFGSGGSSVAAPIWKAYMTRALDATPVEGFTPPSEPEPCSKPMVCGGEGERTVRINTDTGKLASEFTPASKIKEVVYRETHSILHYVNRADPLGTVPENPGTDPQYALWEEPIQAWADEQGFVNQEPPTETDTIYRPEDQPSISITSPTNGDIITQNASTFTVTTQARRGVQRVDYYLDDVKIGSSNASPFNFTFNPSPATPNGSYDLRAIAVDDIGNEAADTVNIGLQVQRDASEWKLTWTNLTDNGVYTTSELPEAINVAITNPGSIQKIDFYQTVGGNRTFIGAQSIGAEDAITQSWTPPTKPDTYYLSMVVTELGGRVITYPRLTFILLAEEE